MAQKGQKRERTSFYRDEGARSIIGRARTRTSEAGVTNSGETGETARNWNFFPWDNGALMILIDQLTGEMMKFRRAKEFSSYGFIVTRIREFDFLN